MIKRLRIRPLFKYIPGMCVRELARRANVSPSCIYGWDKGEYIPSDALINKLAEILEVEPDQLMIPMRYV